MMKRLHLLSMVLALFAIIIASTAFGQSVGNYAVARSTGITFTSISSTGTSMTGWRNALSTDDNLSTAQDIGFTFYYDGTPYTKFSLSTNGFLTFNTGTSAIGSLTGAYGYQNTQFSAVGGSVATLAPFYDDQQTAGNTGTQADLNNSYKYLLSGSAPNRVATIEWVYNQDYSTTSTSNFAYQVKLYESDMHIEFIYGTMTLSNSSTVTPMSYSLGINAPTISSTPTVSELLTQQTVNTTTFNNTASNSLGGATPANMPTANSMISFTPVSGTSPVDPTTLTFTSVGASGMTVNWVDNSTTESYFTVTRALDAGFTSGVVNTNVNSTTSAATGGAYNLVVTGLAPGITYYYKIVAANEGSAPSTPGLTGNQATTPPGNITSTGTGGLWSATSTWVGGVLPTSVDNVTIADGATVTVDITTATCWDLTVGQGTSGSLIYLAGTASTLTVNGSVTVATGGSFTAGSGALATHALYIGGSTATAGGAGNLTVNGTFDMSTTASVTVTFFGLSESTISGSGATLDFYRVILNKGNTTATSSVTPPILNMNRAWTVVGANTAGLIYTHTAGVLKVGGSFTLSSPLYNTAGYTIPALGGVWLNNPNYVATAQAGSPTCNGLFRMSSGTWNIGTATGNSLSSGTGSVYYIDGGAINVAGRFYLSSSGVYFNQSGGTLTIQTIGNTSTSSAGFYLSSSAGNWIMSGGSVVIQFPNTGTTPYIDYYNSAPTRTYTGGTLQFGNASTGAAKTFSIYGYTPSITYNNAYNHTVKVYYTTGTSSSLYGILLGSLTIPAGGTFNCNTWAVSVAGDVVNNGAITGTTTYDRFDFGGLAPQTYSGSGTFGTVAAPFTGVGVGISNSTTVTVSSPIITTRVNLFAGEFIQSNNITIGNGAATTGYIQRGGGGTNVPGYFDVAPTFNVGTGGLTVNYYSTYASVVPEGFEIPASRSIQNLLINSTGGVSFTGGNLTVGTSAAAGLLTLTLGKADMNGSSLILPFTGTSISGGSTTSYVIGKLVRSFAASRTASGTYSTATFYPIGTSSAYLPLYFDPTTTAGGSVSFSGQAFTTNSGTTGAGVSTLSSDRWEVLNTAGAANFTSALLRIGDAGIASTNQFLQANAAADVYGAVPSVSTYAAGSPNTLTTTGAQIPAASYYGYFAYGDLTPCTAPTAQPTSFATTNMSSTGFSGSFTAASPAPSNYLVVRYASGGTPTNPVDFTTYTVGGTLGTGTVRYIGTGTSFTETGLSASTTYDYYVYSYNNSGCYGPVYLVTSPLQSSVTTCAVIGVPGTPTASSITNNSFTASWTASSTAGVSYILDVATTSDFTTLVPGYNALNVGVGTLTYNITGLSSNTPYYVRVQAFNNTSCYSSYTSTLSTSTLCDPLTLPWSENFDAVTVPAMPSCWNKGTTSWVTTNNANSSYDADAHSGTQFLRETYSTTNEYVWTPGFALTAGNTYDFSFWWAGDTYAGWTGDVFYNTSPSATGATQLGSSFVTSGTTTTKTYAQVKQSFTPSSSGTYYFAIRVTGTSAPWYLSFDDFSLVQQPTDAVDWCNLQYPATATVTEGSTVDVYAQTWEPGVTPGAGAQGAGISAWIGYSTTNTDPSGGSWTWYPATFNAAGGGANNDEYMYALGAGLSAGTYYYASRFQLNGGPYKYGGYSSGGGGFWDGTSYVNGVLTVNPITVNVPYSQNFDGVTAPALPAGWKVEDANSDAFKWTNQTEYPNTPANCMRIVYNTDLVTAMNDWFFTPGINLVSGKSYILKFNYRARSASYPEKLEVKYGSSATSAGMTSAALFSNTNITNTTYSEGSFTFTAASSGVFFIGFHGFSDADKYNLYVDDFSIDFAPNTWTGATSTDWNTATNWSLSAVPTATDNAIIPVVSNLPIVNEAPATPAVCNNLTINSGASVTVAAGKALTVNGTLTNNAGNTGLVMKSDATGTGSLLHNTAAVAGTIERYITGSAVTTDMKYHFVSVPMASGGTAAQFLGSYLFNFDVASNAWVAMGSPTTTALDNTKGYMIYYPDASITYTFTGNLNSGAFSPTCIQGGSNFNLVPNPYPSAIDWNAASGWTKTGIGGTFYIWPSGASASSTNYATYNGTVGTNGGTQYIPEGQSFFVEATSAPTFSMNNSVRVHNAQAFWKNGITVPNLLRINAVAANSAFDEAVVNFREDATTAFDNQVDARKLQGGSDAPQLSTLGTDNTHLTINSMPFSTQEYIIPMAFSWNTNGNVALNFSGMESFDATTPIYLEDLKAGTLTDIRLNPTYSFTNNISDPETRFQLRIGMITTVKENTAAEGTIYLSNGKLFMDVPMMNGSMANIMVYDALGKRIIADKQRFSGIVSIPAPLANGVYLIQINNGSKSFTGKVVVE